MQRQRQLNLRPPWGQKKIAFVWLSQMSRLLQKNTVFTFYHKWTVSMTCRDYINHGSAIQIKISWPFFDFLVIHCRKNGRCGEVIRDFAIPRRDGNENVKNNNKFSLVDKTTTLHVHLTFLYISLPLLHDYDVKLPNFTF